MGRARRDFVIVVGVVAIAAAAAIVGLIVLRGQGGQDCISLGVSSNYQYSGNLPNAAHDLPKLTRDDVTSVREDILWETVQPTRTTWDWQRYDRLFTVMSLLHVHVLPIIDYGTTWASAPRPASALPSTAAGQQAYARFAAAVVGRYGPGGTFWAANPRLPALTVESVELWNEPWFASRPSVDDYVSLLQLAGRAVHHVNARVLVAANVDDRPIGGFGSQSHTLWGAAVMDHVAELRGIVDRWAIHPYPRGDVPDPARNAVQQVLWLQRTLKAHDVSGAIWVTELGFRTTDTESRQTPTESFVDFVQAMRRLIGANPVTALWMFTPARPTPATRPGSFDYGFNLVNDRGQVSPAFRAVADARCGS